MANSTVLRIVQSFCREYALPVPTALQGSTDAGAIQMRELVQSVGEEVREKVYWQQCSRRVNWTSVAGTDQGAISTLFPQAFDRIIPRTFWDMSQRREIWGPVTDLNWQVEMSLMPSGPLYVYRVANGRLETSDGMPAGESLSAIYKSRYWIVGPSPAFPSQESFLTDSDTMLFPDSLMKKGLRAYWLRAKQQPHRAEFAMFEDALALEGSNNTVQPVLHMDSAQIPGIAGIIIPIGNWTIP